VWSLSYPPLSIAACRAPKSDERERESETEAAPYSTCISGGPYVLGVVELDEKAAYVNVIVHCLLLVLLLRLRLLHLLLM
jgi:hypothetical protein